MTVKQRYEGFQTLCSQLNKSACHFLVLLSIAEEENIRCKTSSPYIDLIDIVRVSQSKGWITYDFHVKDGNAILNYCTGKDWTRSEKLPELPLKIKDNQYTECNWYNPQTGLEHFTRRNIDTLENSQTVKNGYIRFYYIWTCED